MKHLSTTIILFVCISKVFAQDLPAAAGVSNNILGHTAFAEAYDVHGKPLTEVNKKIAGLSVLNENWGTGEVKFRNGFTFKNMELQFDLFSNELHFRKDNIGYSFVDALKEFTMVYPQNDKMHAVVFRAGYPGLKRKTENTFYQVVADGKKLHLLNYMSKQVREEYDYSGPIRHSYQLDNAYFVYDAKQDVLKEVFLNKAALMKALPGYADAIRKFSDDKKYKLKSEAEAIELFQILNPL